MYVEGTHMCLVAAYLKICQAAAYGKTFGKCRQSFADFPNTDSSLENWASSYHVCVAKCFGCGRKHANWVNLVFSFIFFVFGCRQTAVRNLNLS